jgi:hypothetical protein
MAFGKCERSPADPFAAGLPGRSNHIASRGCPSSRLSGCAGPPFLRQNGASARFAGLAWLGLAWLGLAWLGLAWLGLAYLCGYGAKLDHPPMGKVRRKTWEPPGLTPQARPGLLIWNVGTSQKMSRGGSVLPRRAILGP